MKSHSTVKVQEWFYEKTYEAAKKYNMMLVPEYGERNGIRMADHTTLFVDEVLAETEKSYKVAVDAETYYGNPKTWTTWIPKSVVVA